MDTLRLDQPKVSKHLRILSDCGIVQARPVANRRVYYLQPKPFKELQAWIETYRRITDDSFNRMEDYMRELQEKKGGKNE